MSPRSPGTLQLERSPRRPREGTSGRGGLVATTFTWVAPDMFTLVAAGYVPWGGAPRGGIPTSDFGSGPTTLFLQARLYD